MIIQGDALHIPLGDESVDSIVTDCPYNLGFMGKGWDKSGVANKVETWLEAFRVLKPGGHLLAFGGTRTCHRMVCAVEDAGFEIRDQILWLYGQGFPKSLDISKAIDEAAGAEREMVGENPNRRPDSRDSCSVGLNPSNVHPVTLPATHKATEWQGWGTALKPAHEPIVLARKPLSEKTVASNVLEHGVGGLNIDGCRILGAMRTDREGMPSDNQPIINEIYGEAWMRTYKTHNDGRWPANVVLSHSEGCKEIGTKRVRGSAPSGPNAGGKKRIFKDFVQPPGSVKAGDKVDPDGFETVSHWECVGASPPGVPLRGCAVAMLDQQSGESKSTGGRIGNKDGGIAIPHGNWAKGDPGFGDTGGASRFFYTAKASRGERNAGCEDLYWKIVKDRPSGVKRIDLAEWEALGREEERIYRETGRRVLLRAEGNIHATVKPISLLRWLIRLITPPGGVVLDQFGGSGTTACAAVLEGFFPIVIDNDWDYCVIARLRLAYWEREAAKAARCARQAELFPSDPHEADAEETADQGSLATQIGMGL